MREEINTINQEKQEKRRGGVDEGDEKEKEKDLDDQKNWESNSNVDVEFQLNLPKIKTHVNSNLNLNLNQNSNNADQGDIEDEKRAMKSVSKWTCCVSHGRMFQRKSSKRRSATPLPVQHEKRRSMVPQIIGVENIVYNEGPETEIRLQQENLAAYENICSEVAPDLFISGGEAAQNPQIIQQHKITHIINCVGYLYPEKFSPEIKYLTLFLMDSDHEDISCILYMCFDFIQNAKKNDINATILVHCQKGVSRSVAIVIGYLMWLNNQSFETVFEKVRQIRTIASPNIGFVCALMKWERRKNGTIQGGQIQGGTIQPLQIFFHRIAPHVEQDALRLVPKPPPNFFVAFDPRFVYLICYNHQIYIWEGSQANQLFIQAAQKSAEQIIYYENPFNQIINVKQNQEPQSLILKLREFDLGVCDEGGLIVCEQEMHNQELEWFEHAQYAQNEQHVLNVHHAQNARKNLEDNLDVVTKGQLQLNIQQQNSEGNSSVYYSAQSSKRNNNNININQVEQKNNQLAVKNRFRQFFSKFFK